MKRTVLDYTQNILSALGADEVNSISDTTESLQVVDCLETSFYNLASRANLPEQKKPFQLDASLTILEPILMFIPSGIKSIEWLKYFDNVDSMYKYVTILPLQQFVDYVNGYNTTDPNVETLNFTVNSEVFKFNYKNNVTPRYCTVISNYYVIFDSYDATVDDTLQSSKTMSYGLFSPVFLKEDSFVPDLDDHQVALLLNEAKSLAFFELKQMPHTKAEQEIKRQMTSLQRDKSVDNKPSYFDQLPDFGRKAANQRNTWFRW